MKLSVIVQNGKPIAQVKTNLKSGTEVRFSSQRVVENINANREYNLVNAQAGKISFAKKYLNNNELLAELPIATTINSNDDEFRI